MAQKRARLAPADSSRRHPTAHAPHAGARGHRFSDPGPVFAALADPTRRSLFEALTAGGSATATQLAVDAPVSRQAVVKHLQALADAGLVVSERQGREQRFRPTPEPLADAVAWIVQ